MPLNRCLYFLLDQPLHQVRAHDVLAKPRLLQQLEVPQRRPRVDEVLEVGRLSPVLQVGEVGDKGGLRQELLRGEVVEVIGVGEGLDKLGGATG